MKKIVFVLSLISFSLFAQAESIVNGVVKGLKKGKAEITYTHPITMQRSTWTSEVEKGKFSIKLDIKTATMLTMSIEKEQTNIYLAPNKTLNVNLDFKEFDESLVYSGDYANENNFLKAYYLEFEDEGKDPTRSWFSDLESEDYQKSHKERLERKIALLDNFKAKNPLSDAFYGDWKTNETYFVNAMYLYYPGIKAYYSKKSKAEIVHEGYYSFLDDCDLNNESNLHLSNYNFFLNQFVQHKLTELQTGTEGAYSASNFFFVSKLILTGKCLAAAQAYDLRNSLTRMPLKDIDPYWEDFKNNCDKDVADYLQSTYDKVAVLQPGNPAPTFTLTSIEGKEVSLSDFKGKVVYLDFWASWCGPCLQQIPSAKELKHDFEGKEVVFLYVSIDEKEDSWKKMIKDKELTGVHLLAKGFKHDVPQSYNVMGIPSYFVIDREGNILDNNAPRPSSGDVIKDLLNEALTK